MLWIGSTQLPLEIVSAEQKSLPRATALPWSLILKDWWLRELGYFYLTRNFWLASLNSRAPIEINWGYYWTCSISTPSDHYYLLCSFFGILCRLSWSSSLLSSEPNLWRASFPNLSNKFNFLNLIYETNCNQIPKGLVWVWVTC